MRARGFVLAGALVIMACHTDMYEQAKLRPLEESTLFADRNSSRPFPEGVVPRGEPVTPAPPPPVTAETMAHGRERYDIFCAPCHGRLGDGRGIVVLRGFKAPESFHVDRLRAAPPRYFVDVIERGYGAMYSFGDRIPPQERWEIAAYIRALERSQSATIADVPKERYAELP